MDGFAVNVDVDRLKFLTGCELGLEPALLAVLGHREIKVVDRKFHSFVALVSKVETDVKFLQVVRSLIDAVYERGLEVIVSGNGMEGHKETLAKVFGADRALLIRRQSQVKGIVAGLQEMAKDIPNQFYRIKGQSLLDLRSISHAEEMLEGPLVEFPILVVSIKGGVNFYRLDHIGAQPQKVIASIFGEFGLAGFLKLIAKDQPQVCVNELIEQAFMHGSNLRVDLTVGDIYGEGVNQVAGLHKDIIASSMGKANRQLVEVTDHDYVFSALAMFCINVGNLSALVVSSSHQRV